MLQEKVFFFCVYPHHGPYTVLAAECNLFLRSDAARDYLYRLAVRGRAAAFASRVSAELFRSNAGAREICAPVVAQATTTERAVPLSKYDSDRVSITNGLLPPLFCGQI